MKKNAGKYRKLRGVYKVFVAKDFIVSFKKETDGPTQIKGKNKVVLSLNELQCIWDNIAYQEEELKVVYIGSADNLNKRVNLLVKYGYNKVENHYGGRILWQIKDNKQLLLEYLECEQNKIQEAVLIEGFKAVHNGNYKKLKSLLSAESINDWKSFEKCIGWIDVNSAKYVWENRERIIFRK